MKTYAMYIENILAGYVYALSYESALEKVRLRYPEYEVTIEELKL